MMELKIISEKKAILYNVDVELRLYKYDQSSPFIKMDDYHRDTGKYLIYILKNNTFHYNINDSDNCKISIFNDSSRCFFIDRIRFELNIHILPLNYLKFNTKKFDIELFVPEFYKMCAHDSLYNELKNTYNFMSREQYFINERNNNISEILK